MIKDIHILGTISNSSMEILSIILKSHFRDCKINQNNIDEIYIESETSDLYVFKDNNFESDFLISGLFSEGLNKAKEFLTGITQKLDAEKITYEIEYYEKSPDNSSEMFIMESQ